MSGSRKGDATASRASLPGADLDQNLRFFIDAVRDYAVFMLDVDGHVTSWNSGAKLIKGYTAEEIIGRHFSVFYPPEELARRTPWRHMELAARDGRHESEGWRLRKDGTRFWANVVLTALHDASGKLYAYGKVTRDLTERKRNDELSLRLVEEAAARTASERARELAETALQRTRRIQALSAAFSKALTPTQVAEAVLAHGIGAQEAVGGWVYRVGQKGTTAELIHAVGYSDEQLAPLAPLPLDGASPIADAIRRQEAVFATLDELADCYASGWLAPPGTQALAVVPLSVAERAIGAVALAFSDRRSFGEEDRAFWTAVGEQCAQAFDRARLAEEWRSTHEHLSFLSGATKLLASSLDPDTIFENLVRLAVPRLGDWCAVDLLEAGTFRLAAVAHVEPSKVELARELRRRYPPHPDAEHGVPRVVRSGKAELYPEIAEESLVQAARDSEHLRTLRELGLRSAIVVPLSSRGRVLGAFTLISAESNRRYGEADLETLQELAHRAALALENARLYQEAQQAVRVRDEFLSVAGHELRTPLTALRLQIESLLRGAHRGAPDTAALDAGTKRLTSAARMIERLATLIDDLLDVSRISSGRLELRRAEVDLSALVKEVAARFAEELGRSGGRFELSIQPQVIALGDEARLDQVITNLVSNAVKYGQRRPVAIQLTADGRRARLSVTDQGIGIAAEDQTRIFDRFERAVSGRHYGGMGIGLWVVRQLVQAHGGTIQVHSELGEGATFVVELPLQDPPPLQRGGEAGLPTG